MASNCHLPYPWDCLAEGIADSGTFQKRLVGVVVLGTTALHGVGSLARSLQGSHSEGRLEGAVDTEGDSEGCSEGVKLGRSLGAMLGASLGSSHWESGSVAST